MRLYTTGALLALAAATACTVPAAYAETHEIRASQQIGLSYLNLMIMQDQHLVEKQAKKMGLGDVKVSWTKLSGAAPMIDAMLSGSLDFAAVGSPTLVTLWDKTKTKPLAIKGVASLNSMPLYLVTNKPNIKSLKDFGPGDKIAVPSVKISNQAIFLDMAAAKAFGPSQYAKLDSLTVAMPHPDAMAALLSGSGVTAHYSSPPFQEMELAKPNIHKVLSSYDALGGKTSFNLVLTSSRFVKDNPKTYAAFVAALEEATQWINTHKREAAESYKRLSGDKSSVDFLVKILNEPDIQYTVTPQNVMKTAAFLHQIGMVKSQPASWKDLFFPSAYKYKGS